MAKKNLDKTKFRNDGTPRMKRKATYYKLSEKDHPVIIDGLKHYASIYHIALKIGCGYNTLKGYIHKHPELAEVQNEARESVKEFVASQIIRKCAAGYFPALAFYAERQMGWNPKHEYENIGAMPVIQLGIISNSELPPPKDTSEIEELERKYLEADSQPKGIAQRIAPDTSEHAQKREMDEGGVVIQQEEETPSESGFDADDGDTEFFGADFSGF